MPDTSPVPDGVVLYRNLAELVTWKGNYNQGDVGGIYEGIKTFGYNRSISVWKDNIVMAGNHTLLALRYLYKDWISGELETPPDGTGLMVQDKTWFVLVSDCSHLNFKKATAYAIADNVMGQRAVADDRLLVQYLKEIRDYEIESGDEILDATGFDENEIALLDALIKDDYNSDLNELGEKYGETEMSDDDINDEAIIPRLKKIEIKISEQEFERWLELMKGAEVSAWAEKFSEIIFTIDTGELSWFQE